MNGRRLLGVAALALGLALLPVLPVGALGDTVDPDRAESAGAARGVDLSRDQELRSLVEAQLAALDSGPLNAFLDEVRVEYAGELPPFGWRDFLPLGDGAGRAWNPLLWLGALGRVLLRELAVSRDLILRLLGLAVLAGLLEVLAQSFDRTAVHQAARLAVLAVVAMVGLASFRVAVGLAAGAISQMRDVLLAFLPMLIASLAASGSAVQAGLLHPLVVGAVQVVSSYAVEVVFPVVFLAAVLDIVSSLHERYRVSGLASFLRFSAMTVLGLLFAGFLGVVAVQGAAGGVADGVALRTGKFLANTFIPVVGKMFSDATELVFASSALVRNAVGLAGAGIVIAGAALPLAKLSALVVGYRLAAAASQPVAPGPVIGLVHALANALMLLTVVTGVVSLMFLLATTIVVSSGNAALMMR